MVGAIGDIGCFSFQQANTCPPGMAASPSRTMRATPSAWPCCATRLAEPRSRRCADVFVAALNYRMNELTRRWAAPSFASRVGRAGNEPSGDLLTAGLRKVPASRPAPSPRGSHSYWLYAFKITGCDPQEFVTALRLKAFRRTGLHREAHLSVRRRHADRKTFGTSQYPFVPPFSDKVVEYREGLCPIAERTCCISPPCGSTRTGPRATSTT